MMERAAESAELKAAQKARADKDWKLQQYHSRIQLRKGASKEKNSAKSANTSENLNKNGFKSASGR